MNDKLDVENPETLVSFSDADTSKTKATAAQEDYVSPIDDAYIPVDEHIEYVSENGKKVGYKGIYLLPNLLTTAAMFCGFYAVLSAIGDQFEPAVIALIFAGVFDSLDGRVARLMKAQSEFGKEYDSLSDMLSFGLAPAIIVFKFGLFNLGKVGWAISFLYVACAALRLARFNTDSEDTPSNFFSGLASPAAAGTLVSFVWLLEDRGISLATGDEIVLLAVLALIATLTALLMITNIKYYSFKNINTKGRVSFIFLLAIIMMFVFVTIDPPLFLSLFGVTYVTLGAVYTAYDKFWKPRKISKDEAV